MNQGENHVPVPFIWLVTARKNEQIKNPGEIHLEKRQPGKHQIPLEYPRNCLTRGPRLGQVCVEHNALPDERPSVERNKGRAVLEEGG